MEYIGVSLYHPNDKVQARAVAASCLRHGGCQCDSDCKCRQGTSCQLCRYWTRSMVTIAETQGCLAIVTETRPGLVFQVDVYREQRWEWSAIRSLVDELRELSKSGTVSLITIARDKLPGEV